MSRVMRKLFDRNVGFAKDFYHQSLPIKISFSHYATLWISYRQNWLHVNSKDSSDCASAHFHLRRCWTHFPKNMFSYATALHDRLCCFRMKMIHNLYTTEDELQPSLPSTVSLMLHICTVVIRLGISSYRVDYLISLRENDDSVKIILKHVFCSKASVILPRETQCIRNISVIILHSITKTGYIFINHWLKSNSVYSRYSRQRLYK